MLCSETQDTCTMQPRWMEPDMQRNTVNTVLAMPMAYPAIGTFCGDQGILGWHKPGLPGGGCIGGNV